MATPAIPESTQVIPIQDARTQRRNWTAFFFDYVLFGLSLSIINPNTTLPAFIARLTDSKLAIGLVGAIWFGGWLLPQLVVANYLNHRRLKLPHLLISGWVGRPFFWLYGLFLLLGGANYPLVALVLFMVGFTLFVVTDAYASLAYFDIFGKVMSAKERGRVAGTGQVLHGVLAVAAGSAVLFFLSDAGPPFPINYAAIFGLAGVCVMAALVASYFIVEPPGEGSEKMTRWRDFVPRLGQVFKQDRAFVRLTAVRLLAGIHGMATPFYVIYATQVAGQPEAAVGLFLTAQTLGGAISGLGLGYLATRYGPHRVIQVSAAIDILALVLALSLTLGGLGASAGWAFPILFGLLGIIEGSNFLGYFNYTLEIAPPNERPTYIGLINTLAGVLAAMPLLGGWILERSSYTVLFAVAAIGVTPAVFLAMTLRKPQAHGSTPETAVAVTPVAGPPH